MASGHSGSSLPAQQSIPWAALARNLEAWLVHLRTAVDGGHARQVLSLMRGLVSFISNNQGTFLRSLMTSENLPDSLRRLGAPPDFISVFTAILQVITHPAGEARIITFGLQSAPNSDAPTLHHLLQRFQEGLAASTSPSPRSPASPHVQLPSSHAPPPLVVPTALEVQLAALSSSTEIEPIQSIRLSRVRNAVAVSAAALPPDVISGLEEARTVPFVLFRWLTSCYIEALLCVYYGDTTFVVDRKIIYIGPKSESQLEGPVGLPSNEKALLMGPCTLPWQHVAGLLEASHTVDERDDDDQNVNREGDE